IGFSIIAVSLVVITGIVLIESPQVLRLKKSDSNTIQDLRVIQTSIDGFWKSSSYLPHDFEELRSHSILGNTKYDPFDENLFEYTIIDSISYQICANFLSNSIDSEEFIVSRNRRRNDWRHTEGEYCFNLEVGTEIEIEKKK
ncbi:MAG: hypothetical protein HOK29_13225, partial [Candidatus Marinimicrobia bacterium]|nr:hypothetical protein [Candidatus Neomarinimicrobiota bacterium]